MNPLLSKLRSDLPISLNRKQVGEYLGNFISPKYLANLDSQKKGPKAYRAGGRKIVYDRDELLEWLDARMARFGEA